MIEIINLTKKFKEILAVDNVSLKVEKGEVYGLLGENGAGKTTILRLISTMLKPTSGDALLNGKSVVKEPGKVRGEIGILFGGEVGIYDRLTAYENIEYFGQLNGLSDTEVKERIDYLSELLEMKEYINRKVGSFSRGMKQKVAIARSIVHDPNIILFDEPTLGLDVSVARIVHSFIEGLKEEGKTIMFSSHNMSEVNKLCSKVAIINKGKLIYNGELKELEGTGEKSLEDIFVEMVGDKNEK